MFESHTGENMFNLLKKVFDAMCTQWENKLIGYTSDGASNMTGCNVGLGTLLQRVVLSKLYRIWCAAHQLDLLVQSML